MLINKITIYNFRQYKGRQSIDFSTDNKKNVTVILGDNTSGKTTLIQAFNWCLYDNTNFKTKELLNSDIAASMTTFSNQEVYVEVELTHEDKKFVIRRNQNFTLSSNGQVRGDNSIFKVEYREPSGEMQEVPTYECKNTVNKILPEDLSEYFFYDGERDLNSKGDVVSAVRGLMGIDVINETVDHFNPKKAGSVISKLNNELDVGKDQQILKLKDQITAKKIELENYEKRYVEVLAEVDFFERRRDELNNLLIKNSEVKEKQIRKLDLEKDITYFESKIEPTENELIKAFSGNSFRFFAVPLYEKVGNVLDGAKQNAEGIPHMHSKAIDYILRRGKCICGCDLSKNQGAIENIEFERRLLPPQHIGTIIKTYKDATTQNERYVEGFENSIESIIKNIRQIHVELDERRVQYEEIRKDIQGNVDVGKIECDAIANKEQLDEKNKSLLNIRDKKTACNRDMENIEREIEKNALCSKKNERINKEIAYATAIYEWFKQSYDNAEIEVKTELFESINKLFSKMYSGKRKVEIDDKYRIILKVDNGNNYFTTDTSPGLDTVKNFAFICGLVDLARKKARETSTDVNEVAFNTEPYPIVMDAPFSKADDTHITNISKVLPEVAEQVILVVMRKDWEYAKESMRDRLGKLYDIKKCTETNSILEEALDV